MVDRYILNSVQTLDLKKGFIGLNNGLVGRL